MSNFSNQFYQQYSSVYNPNQGNGQVNTVAQPPNQQGGAQPPSQQYQGQNPQYQPQSQQYPGQQQFQQPPQQFQQPPQSTAPQQQQFQGQNQQYQGQPQNQFQNQPTAYHPSQQPNSQQGQPQPSQSFQPQQSPQGGGYPPQSQSQQVQGGGYPSQSQSQQVQGGGYPPQSQSQSQQAPGGGYPPQAGQGQQFQGQAAPVQQFQGQIGQPQQFQGVNPNGGLPLGNPAGQQGPQQHRPPATQQAPKPVGPGGPGPIQGGPGPVQGGPGPVNNIPGVQGQKLVRGRGSTIEQDTRSFAEYLNSLPALHNDPRLLRSGLPINPNDNSLISVCADSIILCKFINSIRAGTIDDSKICVKLQLNVFEKNNNHALAISGARTLGCKITNIGPDDLTQANASLILGMLWQLIRLSLLSHVNLQQHPNLIHLKEETEDVNDFLQLAPETTLLRWFNHHLRNAGHNRRVTNFSNDVSDCDNYAILLNQIAPHLCGLEALQERDPLRKAELVLQNAAKLGCRQFVQPQDILEGNEKLNLAFVANLFNKQPGIDAQPLNQQFTEAVALAVKNQIAKQEEELRQRMKAEEDVLRARLQQKEKEWQERMQKEEAEMKKKWQEEDNQRKMELQKQQQEHMNKMAQWEAEFNQKNQNWMQNQQQHNSWTQQQQSELEMQKQRILQERAQLEEEKRRRQMAQQSAAAAPLSWQTQYSSLNPGAIPGSTVHTQVSEVFSVTSVDPSLATRMGLPGVPSPFQSTPFASQMPGVLQNLPQSLPQVTQIPLAGQVTTMGLPNQANPSMNFTSQASMPFPSQNTYSSAAPMAFQSSFGLGTDMGLSTQMGLQPAPYSATDMGLSGSSLPFQSQFSMAGPTGATDMSLPQSGYMGQNQFGAPPYGYNPYK